MRLGRDFLEWITKPIVLAIMLPPLIFMIPIGILWIWFRKEVKIFLRSFVIFVCITVILCYLIYMASIYIPETEKFLTDASGRFNLGVISMLVAGVSFLAGIEEREKLKKRELELEKKKWIYQAFCEYRAEWEFIFDSYRKVNSFLLKEGVIQQLETEEMINQQGKISEEMIETADKSRNESGKSDLSDDQIDYYNKKLDAVESAIKEKSTKKLEFKSGFSDRTEAMSYYCKIDTHKLNKTYYELRLLVDTDEDKSELEASGRDSDIIEKSMDFIDKTKDEMEKELYVYLFGDGLGIDRYREFHEWYINNKKTKKDIKEELDKYAKKIATETLK